MPEGKTLEAAVEKIMQRLRSVNLLYIRKIAMQIRKIGELGQASVNRLVAMADMNADIGEITERLRRITAVNNRTLQKVFLRAMNEQYTDSRFGRYLAKYPLENAQRQRIEHYVQAVYRQTAGTLANLSNTTAVTMRQAYIGAIDSAILAASTGVASYTETMRDTLRQIGRAGMQVRYASGYRRRLDTAVRQNIVDGINQISKNASVMIGEEINRQAGSDVYDAIEISAHARSAPDHEPVQGHVFMKAEWEKLQAGLVSRDIDGRVFAGFRRPIGEWNCRHTPMSFSTKWSKRKWTDEQLRKYIDENRQGCEIDGKHRTLYEAMQMMREIETAVRREKDTAVAAQAAGDDALRQQCQRNINALVRRYAEIAKASGNAEKRQRMTVEGFRPVKVPQTHESEKGLTSGQKSGMMGDEPRRMRSAPEFAVPKGLTESRGFREKFNNMTDDPVLQRSYYQAAKEMLHHRSGTNGEDLYFYNTRTGEWTKSTTGTLEGRPDYTPEIEKAIAESKRGELVAFHNHPLGMPPSASDFNAALKNGYAIGYTIGHDGRIFEYSAPEMQIPQTIYVNRIAGFKKDNPEASEYEAQLHALIDLQDLFGFVFREVKG